MSDIAGSLLQLKSEIPKHVELVAVSKFHPITALEDAYAAGQRIFGESRVQELLQKIPQLPSDIRWHFIGHLQTNKVRQIIGKTWLIESADSEKLIDLIDRESSRAAVTTRILMQIHVAAEETKFGFSPEELLDFFRRGKYKDLKATRICGVMGMATNTDDERRIREDFHHIYSLYHQISSDYGNELVDFKIVSMGMSDDWKIAVEEGSNMIRIGSRIFGSRRY